METKNDTNQVSTIFLSNDIENVNSKEGENLELKRALKPRHVDMMAICGAIGSGLIIGSGTALKRGGPISLFIAYIITGAILCIVLLSLGEFAAFCPSDKGFAGYGKKYVSPTFGVVFAMNYLIKYLIVYPTNLTGLGLIIQYWRPDLNVGIWVTVFLVVTMISNFFDVKYYGEMEFWFSSIKLVVLLICFVTCLAITCGGGPDGKTIGFQYWREDGCLEYLTHGSTGRFLGFWACIVQSCFSYIGSEAIGVIFAQCPVETIPKASKKVFYRIGFFYIFGVFILGLAVSPKNHLLVTAKGTNASASPFVVAFKTSGIKVLPDFINATLLIFLGSAANTDVYLCSRTLYGMAKDDLIPFKSVFTKLNRFGVPYYSCIPSFLIGLIAYMNCKSSAATIFGYFSSAVTVFGIINWIYICITYLCYNRALRVQNIPKEDIVFRVWFQPYLTWGALFICVIITIFNGYNAFFNGFDYKQFITSYIGIAFNVIFFVCHKIYYKTKIHRPEDINMYDNGDNSIEELDVNEK